MGGRITIIGCGPGAPDLITVRGERALKEADVIAGSRRLLEGFAKDRNAELLLLKGNFKAVLDKVEALGKDKKVVLLVSGDPLFHSFGESAMNRFGGGKCEVIPGVSSFQYAFCRLKESWKDYRLFSIHGTDGGEVEKIFKGNDRFILLLDPRHDLRSIKEKIEGLDTSSYTFYLASNLSMPNEFLSTISIDDVDPIPKDRLSILVVRKDNA